MAKKYLDVPRFGPSGKAFLTRSNKILQELGTGACAARRGASEAGFAKASNRDMLRHNKKPNDIKWLGKLHRRGCGHGGAIAACAGAKC